MHMYIHIYFRDVPARTTLYSVKKTTSQNLWPRINLLIKTARSVYLRHQPQIFEDISSASERAFPVCFGDIFGCSTPSKKRCFSTQEFTCFLSTVLSQRRATRSGVSFQSK